MTSPLPDPTSWLTDLIKTQPPMVLWPTGDVANTTAALTAAAAPWTKAVAQMTQWQMDTMKSFWAPFLGGADKSGAGVADRRFSDDAWSSDPRYELVAKTYLAQTELAQKALNSAPIDERSKAQWSFALRQVADALSPANTLATNPEALQLAMETGGASLAEGMKLFTEDLAKGRISMTDESAFEVGVNVCTTPGSVVLQNELIQLIQYTPTTENAFKRPLLIVPPCINKYYILDLQPANSFVGHAVAQGHTVFLVSWRNAGPSQEKVTWDDYLEQGVLTAIEAAQKITKADKINALGFCIGGTLIASALAVLAARDQHPVASLTLLTTLLDFTDTGEIGLLVTKEGVAAREKAIGQGGLLKGSELAQVFAALRANDLIWPYVVKGYLKGQPPPAFDLLYWNSDDTNLPGPMFCYYIRNTYLENKLREPGALTMLGEKVDLGALDIPVFVYASKEDHIVPWTSAYQSTQLLRNATFVLGASGHIAGVINPPAKMKRNFWIAPEGGGTPAESDAWLEDAEKVPGSWWPTWYEWLAPHGGTQVKARTKLGSAQFAPLEEAPGSYVKQKAT